MSQFRALADGTFLSKDTGKVYTAEQLKAAHEKKVSREGEGFSLSKVFTSAYKDGEFKPTGYEQAGAIDNAIQGKGRGVDVPAMYNANMYQETDADKAARLKEAANILGMDDNVLMRGGLSDNQIMSSALALAKKKENEPDDWDAFVEQHPATVKYLNEQRNMAVSYDDIKPLGRLEDTVTSIKEHMELTEIEERRAEIGKALRERGGTYADLTPAEIAELEGLNARRKELGQKYADAWDVDNVIGGIVGGMVDDVIYGAKIGAGAAGVAAGLTAMTGPGALAAGLVAFGYGFAGGMTYAGANRSMNNFYLDNAERTAKNGEHMDATSNLIASTAYGMGMAALYSGAGGRLLAKMPGAGEAISAFTKHMPQEIMENAALRKPAWDSFVQNLGKFSKSTGEQAVLMGGATKAVELAARATAEQFSGLEYDHTLEPSAFNQIAKATIDFIPTGAAFSSVPMAANALVKPRSETSLTPTSDVIALVMDTLAKTKTAGRSKEATGDVLKANISGTPLEEMHISAADFVAHFQTADESLSASAALSKAQAEAEKLGIRPEDFKRAFDTGEELNIDTVAFFKQYQGTPDVQGLSPYIRFGNASMSDKQIQDLRQEVEQFNKDFQAASKDETFSKDSPAYQAALRLARQAYPGEKNANVEQQAKLMYFLAQRMEDRGILSAIGYKDAAEALNVEVRRRESYGQLQGEMGIESPIAAQGETKGVYLSSEEAQPIIGMFRTADRSTLPHEIMHHTLGLYRKAIAGGKVSAEVKADWKTLMDYAGVKDGEEITVKQEEKITDAWEKYLSEGKAPSLELVGVFQKFKRWLKNVYQKLVGAGESVNADVRDVFDRMLASEQQLEQAEVFYNSAHLMAGKEMGLTELKQYAAALNKAHQEAQKEMAARVARELKPETQKLIADLRKVAAEEEGAKLSLEPVYIARALMAAPAKMADVKKAQAEYRQKRLDEEVRLLVREAKQGVIEKGRVVTPDGEMTDQHYGDGSLNYQWYKDMLARHNGKLPPAWSKYIDKVKAGDESAKMPPKMREEFEYIAEERLREGYREDNLGDVPPDDEFLRLTSDTPGIDFVIANGGGLKLNREATEAQYGKGAVPENWLSKDGQFTLDDVAEITGFSSGDALRQEILARPTYAQALRERVDARVNAWKEEHLGSFQDAAALAISNQHTLEAIGVEIEAMAKAAQELREKNEQATADAMAEGREKAEQERKTQEKVAAAENKTAERVARETRRLDAQAMRGTERAKAAREYARDAIGKQAIGDLKDWKKYLTMSVQAGRQAIKAMQKGDYDTAVVFKNQELVARAMAIEASKAKKEVDAMGRFFDKVDARGLDMKGIDHAFNLQIDRLLDKFNLLKKRTPIEPLNDAENVTLEEFVNQLTEDYFAPDVSKEILEAEPMDYTRLSLEQMRELKRTVQNLQTYGKATVNLLNGEKKPLKEIIIDLTAQIGLHKERYTNLDAPGKPKETVFDKLTKLPGLISDSLVKNETLMRLIDEGEYGVAQRYIEAPIREGERQYQVRNNKSMEAIKKIIADAGLTEAEMREWRSDSSRRHFDFLPNDLTLEERIVMALNWGNEGNRDRLRYYFETKDQKKRHGKLNEAELAEVDGKVMQVIGSLEKKHLDFVQGVWDYLDSYKEEVRQHELECSGTDVKMVEATPFKMLTASGEMVDMKGGYYPIKYDPEKSRKAYQQEELNALYKQASAVSAMTEHGHTESRMKANGRPIQLSLRGLSEHITNVNYDLSMRKAIIDVRRILKNEQFAGMIESRFGVDAYRGMENWLKYVASDQREPVGGLDKFLKAARMHMSVATMGFRLKALVEDLPGNFMTACWQMGFTDTIKSMTEFYQNPMELKNFVDSMSPMMAEKTKFLDRDIQDFSKRMFEPQGIVGKSVSDIGRYSFIIDQFADSIINYPLWNHIYKQEIAKGTAEKEAVEIADGFIRRSSIDAGRAGTVGVVRNNGEKGKALTMFYSWYSGLFNRYWSTAQMTRHLVESGNTLEAAKTFVRGATLGFIIPAMWAGFVAQFTGNDRTKDPKKRKEHQQKAAISAAAGYAAGTIPLLGSLGAYSFDKALGDYATYDFSPVEGGLRHVAEYPYELFRYAQSDRKGEDRRRLATKSAEFASYTVPLPMRPVTIVNNMIDWMDNNGDLSIADFISKRKYK